MASGSHIQMEVNSYIKYWISQCITPGENVDDYVITDSIAGSSDTVDSESQNQNDDVEVIEVPEDSEMHHASPESTSDTTECGSTVYTDFQNFTNSAPNVFVVPNFTHPSSSTQHVVLPISTEHDPVLPISTEHDPILPISTEHDPIHSEECSAGPAEQNASRDPKPTHPDTERSDASSEVLSGGGTPCITIDSESDTESYEIVDQASVSNKTPSAGPGSDTVSSTSYPYSSGDHYSSDTEIADFKKGNRFHPYQTNSKKKKFKGIPISHVLNIEAKYRQFLAFGAKRLYRLYPSIWKGALILKSLKTNVEIKILNGNAIVANMCLLKVNDEVSIKLIKKVRWTSTRQLYVKFPSEQIIMIVLPEKDQPGSFNNLRGIGGYLQHKQSAGLVISESIYGVHFAAMFYPKNNETMNILKCLDKEAHTLLLKEYFMLGIIKQLE